MAAQRALQYTMRSMKRVLCYLVMIVFSSAVVAAKIPSFLYKAEVGSPPPPRPLNAKEKQVYQRVFKAGKLKQIPETVQDAPPVKLSRISGKALESLIAEIGSPLDRLPSPDGLIKAATPRYPADVAKAGESASALCYFEVMSDGSVGRIYGENISHESFFIECACALSVWKFKPSEKSRFCRFLFEAQLSLKR